jgi:hypothetical protein
MAMVALHNALQPIWLLSLGVWLAIGVAVFVWAWPLRATPSGAFAIGVTGSGIIYVLSYVLFGVAADFRYGYWCVLASLVGGAAVAAGRHQGNSDRN